MKLTVHYKLGHSYDFEYEKTELFCPNCGSKSVWVEQGEGDYYSGPTHVCTNCWSDFTIQGPHDARYPEAEVILQILGVKL